MLKIFTLAELVAEWRLRNGLTPASDDWSVAVTDGYDAEEMVSRAVRDAYLRLLDTAPPQLLKVEDVTSECLTSIDAEGVVEVGLPPRVRRVVEVTSPEWGSAARIADADSTLGRLQLNRRTRGGTRLPVAVASRMKLRLYSFPGYGPLPPTLTVRAVTEPYDNSYTLDTSLLPELCRLS